MNPGISSFPGEICRVEWAVGERESYERQRERELSCKLTFGIPIDLHSSRLGFLFALLIFAFFGVFLFAQLHFRIHFANFPNENPSAKCIQMREWEGERQRGDYWHLICIYNGYVISVFRILHDVFFLFFSGSPICLKIIPHSFWFCYLFASLFLASLFLLSLSFCVFFSFLFSKHIAHGKSKKCSTSGCFHHKIIFLSRKQITNKQGPSIISSYFYILFFSLSPALHILLATMLRGLLRTSFS